MDKQPVFLVDIVSNYLLILAYDVVFETRKAHVHENYNNYYIIIIIYYFNFKRKVVSHCSYNLPTAFPVFQSSTQPWIGQSAKPSLCQPVVCDGLCVALILVLLPLLSWFLSQKWPGWEEGTRGDTHCYQRQIHCSMTVPFLKNTGTITTVLGEK